MAYVTGDVDVVVGDDRTCHAPYQDLGGIARGRKALSLHTQGPSLLQSEEGDEGDR